MGVFSSTVCATTVKSFQKGPWCSSAIFPPLTCNCTLQAFTDFLPTSPNLQHMINKGWNCGIANAQIPAILVAQIAIPQF